MLTHKRVQYRLTWDGGPGAVIDLHRLGDVFMLRYDPPLRQTLRRGLEELPFTPEDLEGSVRGLRKLVGSVGLSPGRGARAASRASGVLAQFASAGEFLFRLVLPRVAGTDLGGDSLFIEVGTDEDLLPVPWELMCGREGFICLRHAMGRYVNLRTESDLTRTLDRQGDLRVLLVCVPKPQPSAAGEYERLEDAQTEFDAVTSLLVDLGVDCVALRADEATKDHVIGVLRDDQRFTIIHFTGHGHIDERDPRRSGLVLFDEILTTGVLSKFVRHAPVLAFINGCETARTQEAAADGNANKDIELPLSHLTRVFGIARPFLDQGSYVLGTRWRVGDGSAARFAETFYGALLDGNPIGKAIMKGRNEIYDPGSADLSWASYVYYGDPRLMFQLSTALDDTGRHPPVQSPESVPAEVEGLSARPPEERARPPGSEGESSGSATQVADSDRTEPHEATAAAAATTAAPLPPDLIEVARQVTRVRREEPPSARRTIKLEKMLDRVRTRATEVRPNVAAGALQVADEGQRIVGLVLAEGNPRNEHTAILIGIAGHPSSDFEQYHAFVALHAAVDQLDDPSAARLREMLLDYLKDPRLQGTDRDYVARETIAKLDRRLGQGLVKPSPADPAMSPRPPRIEPTPAPSGRAVDDLQRGVVKVSSGSLVAAGFVAREDGMIVTVDYVATGSSLQVEYASGVTTPALLLPINTFDREGSGLAFLQPQYPDRSAPYLPIAEDDPEPFAQVTVLRFGRTGDVRAAVILGASEHLDISSPGKAQILMGPIYTIDNITQPGDGGVPVVDDRQLVTGVVYGSLPGASTYLIGVATVRRALSSQPPTGPARPTEPVLSGKNTVEKLRGLLAESISTEDEAKRIVRDSGLAAREASRDPLHLVGEEDGEDVAAAAVVSLHERRLRALGDALERVVPSIFRDPRISVERLEAASMALLSLNPLIEALSAAAEEETQQPMRHELQQLDHILQKYRKAVSEKLSALGTVRSERAAMRLCDDLAKETTGLLAAGAQAIRHVT